MTNAPKLTAAQQKIMDRFAIKPTISFAPSNGAETLAAKALVRKGFLVYAPVSDTIPAYKLAK